jgi:predicted O-methyltransferase YrrM
LKDNNNKKDKKNNNEDQFYASYFSNSFCPLFDFVYIDGQKSKYLDFLFLILAHCSPDATILFDDVLAFPEKTKALRDRIDHNKIPHRLIKHHDGDGMLILRKEWLVTN